MDRPVSLVFAEFGSERKNAGDQTFVGHRLNPALDSARQQIDVSRVYCLTDQDDFTLDGVDVIQVKQTPFDANDSRYGWRCNDYYKVKGLLQVSRESDDVVISLDSDMHCIAGFEELAEYAIRFGFCAPLNPRYSAGKDSQSECDGREISSHLNAATAYNMSPLAMHGARFAGMVRTYLNIMECKPCRGPIALAEAVWESGMFPYVLGPQWCVCCGHEGIDNPRCLHVGHKAIASYYSGWVS